MPLTYHGEFICEYPVLDDGDERIALPTGFEGQNRKYYSRPCEYLLRTLAVVKALGCLCSGLGDSQGHDAGAVSYRGVYQEGIKDTGCHLRRGE
jgi:hypothetical protein